MRLGYASCLIVIESCYKFVCFVFKRFFSVCFFVEKSHNVKWTTENQSHNENAFNMYDNAYMYNIVYFERLGYYRATKNTY